MITNKLQRSDVGDAESGMPCPSQFHSGIRRRELLLTTALTLLFSTSSDVSNL